MKKIFGVSDDRNAYFYEVETNNLDDLILGLKKCLTDYRKEVIVCNFYDNKAHDFGIYQKAVDEGRATINHSKIIKKTKQKSDKEETTLGVVAADMVFHSEIASIIDETFNGKGYYDDVLMIDLTKLIKVDNIINNKRNNFTYDGTLDGIVNINIENYALTDLLKSQKANSDLFLNEKEQELLPYQFKRMIEIIANNLSFKYIGSCELDKEYSESIEIMKRFALRNKEIKGREAFIPIINKISKSVKDISFDSDVIFYRYSLDGRNNDDIYQKSLKKRQKYGIM